MMVVLLETAASDQQSCWSPWLESLPRSFPIGISLDPIERSHVQRMAPAFLEQQEKQWNACWHAIQQVVVINSDEESSSSSVELPTGFREYLLQYQSKDRGKKDDLSSSSTNNGNLDNDDDDDDKTTNGQSRSLKELVQWAFGVVFTRSWRSPDGTAATLVPLGDMFNHDSAMANVYPTFVQEDGSIQMKLKRDVEPGSPLYLSYGMGDQPARFLVNFGFWDRSARWMNANLTVPEDFVEDWKVDPSELVVSTRSGGISEEVWNLAVYRFLLDRDMEIAAELAQARKDEADQAALFQAMLDQYEIPAILYLRKHALQIVGETYPEMDLCPEGNPMESPRRFGMIARYNNGMRESWMRVAESLEHELEEALKKRQG